MVRDGTWSDSSREYVWSVAPLESHQPGANEVSRSPATGQAPVLSRGFDSFGDAFPVNSTS